MGVQLHIRVPVDSFTAPWASSANLSQWGCICTHLSLSQKKKRGKKNAMVNDLRKKRKIHPWIIYPWVRASLVAQLIKNPPAMGSIPGLGRCPGEGNGNLLQYSGIENSMDCRVHGVAKSWPQLSDFHFHFIPESRVFLGYHSCVLLG